MFKLWSNTRSRVWVYLHSSPRLEDSWFPELLAVSGVGPVAHLNAPRCEVRAAVEDIRLHRKAKQHSWILDKSVRDGDFSRFSPGRTGTEKDLLVLAGCTFRLLNKKELWVFTVCLKFSTSTWFLQFLAGPHQNRSTFRYLSLKHNADWEQFLMKSPTLNKSTKDALCSNFTYDHMGADSSAAWTEEPLTTEC